MKHLPRMSLLATATALLTLGAAACGSSSTSSTSSMSSAASSAKIGGSVTVWAEWTSTEQQDFLAAVHYVPDDPVGWQNLAILFRYEGRQHCPKDKGDLMGFGMVRRVGVSVR